MPPGAALGGGHRRGGPEDGPPVCESPGRGLSGQVRRPRIIDPYLAEIEGVGGPLPRQGPRRCSARCRLVAVGFSGDERTTRRAVAEAKAAWRAGRRRTYRPWITEPGL